MASHLEATLKEDLEEIRSKVILMGQLAETAVRSSIQAVLGRNRPGAYGVILRDRYIDRAENELDRLCLRFLVRGHRHECESARLTRHLVLYKDRFANGAGFGKKVLKVIFCGVEGKIPDIKFGSHMIVFIVEASLCGCFR